MNFQCFDFSLNVNYDEKEASYPNHDAAN